MGGGGGVDAVGGTETVQRGKGGGIFGTFDNGESPDQKTLFLNPYHIRKVRYQTRPQEAPDTTHDWMVEWRDGGEFAKILLMRSGRSGSTAINCQSACNNEGIGKVAFNAGYQRHRSVIDARLV